MAATAPHPHSVPTRVSARVAHYLVPLTLLAVVAAIVVVVTDVPRLKVIHSATTHSRLLRPRHLPPYWTVRVGDSFSSISRRTGLTIAQLEAFNPNADQFGLMPGERLNLWAHPPQPPRKPPGPMYWTVKPGESFGLIAARTRISISTLEQLNPQISPSKIQPGDRVRLRH